MKSNISIFLFITLLGCAATNACEPYSFGNKIDQPIEPVQGKALDDGLIMRWVDGSILVSGHLNGPFMQPQPVWIQRDPVNGYMFNLCIESGSCPKNWDKPDSPVSVSVVNTEAQKDYCQWAGGGRPVTEEDMTQIN